MREDRRIDHRQIHAQPVAVPVDAIIFGPGIKEHRSLRVPRPGRNDQRQPPLCAAQAPPRQFLRAGPQDIGNFRRNIVRDRRQDIADIVDKNEDVAGIYRFQFHGDPSMTGTGYHRPA